MFVVLAQYYETWQYHLCYCMASQCTYFEGEIVEMSFFKIRIDLKNSFVATDFV